MRAALLALALLAIVGACGSRAPSAHAESASTALMDWPDLTNRPRPTPTHTIHVAGAPDADLWLPEGAGPFPVVLMVHGGCWQTSIATHTLMNYAAEALRHEGIAVWNIEYRGVDDAGGGYPGTYQDVARAADTLRAIAPRYHLDLQRLVGFGHSAGGHLVAWLAARPRLPRSSPLYAANPLHLSAIVTVGGLQNLRNADQGCAAHSVGAMTGAPSASRPNVFADTSPAELLPLGVHTMVMTGDSDGVAPPALSQVYVTRAAAAGDVVELIVTPHSGHVEEIAPGTHAWLMEVGVIRALIAEAGRAPPRTTP